MVKNALFPKGSRAAEHFTGTAYVNMQIPDARNSYQCQVYDVVFAPGSRNDWHSHAGGQFLLCTDGVGYYQEKGKPERRLQRGDVVEIPPDVIHWHGAAPDSSFMHIGISPQTEKGSATWYAPVTDAEYNKTTGGTKHV